MRKFTGLVSFLLAALTLLLDASSLFAQTVYFQRNLNTGSQEGRLSFGPSDGSVTANDLISGMSSTVDAGITTDGLGNFFISSPVTSEILKIDYLANTSVVANSTATLYRPTFLTLDSSNKRLYYWDQSIYTINRIEVRTVLPVTSSDVSIFADNTSYTSSITDIKFNIVDRHLYWTHNNRLFRAP